MSEKLISRESIISLIGEIKKREQEALKVEIEYKEKNQLEIAERFNGFAQAQRQFYNDLYDLL